MAEEVLRAGQGSGAPGDAHRHPGERHPAGELGQHRRIVGGHPVRAVEEPFRPVTEQRDDARIEGVVRPSADARYQSAGAVNIEHSSPNPARFSPRGATAMTVDDRR